MMSMRFSQVLAALSLIGALAGCVDNAAPPHPTPVPIHGRARASYNPSGSFTYGTVTANVMASPQVIVSGGTVDGTVVGGQVPAAGAFTSLQAKTLTSPQVTVSGGTVDGTVIGGQVPAAGSFTSLQAGTLVGTALPNSTFQGQFEDKARALAARVSMHLNVMAFGAKGDGVTDDTLAFQNAAAVATGHIPTGLSATLTAYLTALVNFSGVGVKPNGAVEIDIPAGHYILSASIAVMYAPNSAIHWRGDGSSMTELQWNGPMDGLVTTFSSAGTLAHNAMERTGAWNGQAIEVTGIHFMSNTGIIPLVAGGTNIGNGQGESGAAVKTIALPVIGASTPPIQLYDDLEFTNTQGWNDGANNWQYGLYLQDPDSLFVNRLFWSDRSLASNVTSTVIYVHSTASSSGPGHEFLNFDNLDILGGNMALQMDGNDIQGVNISHLTAAFMQQGVVWLPPSNSLSGSLTLADSSIGAAYSMLHVANASTIYSHDNFFYNVGPPVGTNPIFFYVIGGDTLISHHDQFVGPLPGYEGTGYSSTAMFISGYTSADVSPGHVSDDVVSHFDNGILFGGGSTINFTNDVVASDTTRCYGDTSGSTSTNLRGQFDGIYCGGTVNMHDGVGLSAPRDWAVQRFYNAGIELGMPGVTSPGGLTGYGGGIDWHSAPSVDGTVANLNDFDARMTAFGGGAGTAASGSTAAAPGASGQGGLLLTAALGLETTGPVQDHSAVRLAVTNGGTYQAAANISGVMLAPGAAISTLSFNLPASPNDGDVFSLGSEQTITTLYLGVGTAGQAINGAPTTIGPTSPVRFKWFAQAGAGGTWDLWP